MSSAAGPARATGSFSSLAADQPSPGVRRQTFSAERATVSRYTFEPGAAFPLHHHPQEQITLVEEGSVEMAIDGERNQLAAGDWSVVGPEVEHGITAGPEGARIIAIVVPPRRSIDEYELSGEVDL